MIKVVYKCNRDLGKLILCLLSSHLIFMNNNLMNNQADEEWEARLKAIPRVVNVAF